MFEETLRIARRTQFFILLSAVVFSAFALSVQPLNRLYSLALSQVETAISIQWENYHPWVKQKFERAKTDFTHPQAAQFYFSQDKHESPIEQAFVKMQPFIQIHHKTLQNSELLTELRGEINFSNKMAFSAATIPPHLSDPQTNSPLDIIRMTQSAKAQKQATMYHISQINAEQAAWQVLYDAIVIHDRYRHEVWATKVHFRANAFLVEPHLNDGKNLTQSPWGKLSISIGGSWITPEATDGTPADARGGSVDRDDITFEAEQKLINQSSILDWLGETYPGLGQSPDGQLNPFYGIEHVWREIAGRPLTDAELYVQALAAEEKRRNDQVNLFGVNVPAQLVPAVGPLTLLFLVCYLSRIIAHLQVHAGHHAKELSEFPWLVLHGKNVWWLDPLFSYLIFPVSTQYIIMSNVKDAGIWIPLGWLFTFLTLLAGLRVWQQLHHLRRTIPTSCE